MSPLKIAIVGGGPVGTMLARLLNCKAPSVAITVFEADTSPNYRSQGGSLDLHTASGLVAIKEANLMDQFLKHARYDGESTKFTDKDLKLYHQILPSESPDKAGGHIGGQRPEIDRGELRKLMLESLPDSIVKWGYKLKDLILADDASPQGIKLVFSVVCGQTTVTETMTGFDLVVGADGGWSKVRSSSLTKESPFFSGVVYHELNVPDASTTMPEVAALVNRGTLFAHRDGAKVALQQMGNGSINVGVFYRVEDAQWLLDPARCGFDATDLTATKKALLQGRLQDWHPLIHEAVEKAQGRTAPRVLYMLPVGIRWAHQAGVTVVGDAAHLMTPFAGEGVNVGMEDAMRLARAVIAAGEDRKMLDQGVEAFEKEMFVRAGRFQRLTKDLLQAWFFTPDSPRAVIPTVMSIILRFHAPLLLKPFAGLVGYAFGKYKASVAA